MKTKMTKTQKIVIGSAVAAMIVAGVAIPTTIALSDKKVDINVDSNIEIDYDFTEKKGIQIKDLEPKVIPGYTFIGFFKDEALQQPFDPNDKITGSITIYAYYEVSVYTINISPNNSAYGSVSEIEIEIEHGATVEVEGNKITFIKDGEIKTVTATPANATDDAEFFFSSWKVGEIELQTGDEIVEDMTITAEFSQREIQKLDYQITDGKITSYTGSGTELIIPESYSIGAGGAIVEGDDFQVTEIGESAFEGQTALTKITLPDSILKIGNSAFAGCTSLKEINIPKNVQELGWFLFEDCDALENVLYSAINAKTGSNVNRDKFIFDINPNLTITVAKVVEAIPDYFLCYYGGQSGTTIYAVEMIIKELVFEENSQLKSIGIAAFANNSYLEEFVIPDGVESIGIGAFAGCENLVKINFPASVISVGDRAFSFVNDGGNSGCRLTDVTIESNYVWQNLRFILSYEIVNLRVLKSLINEGEGESFLPNHTKTDDGDYWLFQLIEE